MKILYYGLWLVLVLSVIGACYAGYEMIKRKDDKPKLVKSLSICLVVLVVSVVGVTVTNNKMNNNFKAGAKQYVLNSVAYYAHQTDGAPVSQLKYNYSELTKNYKKLKNNDTGKYLTKIYDQDVKNARTVHSLDGDYFKSGNVKKLIKYSGSIQKLMQGYESKFGDPTK